MGEKDKIPERVRLLTQLRVTKEVLAATENCDCVFLPRFRDRHGAAAEDAELGYP